MFVIITFATWMFTCQLAKLVTASENISRPTVLKLLSQNNDISHMFVLINLLCFLITLLKANE